MHLKYPQAIPCLYPNWWKNCLPWNWSLVPKRLETSGLEHRGHVCACACVCVYSQSLSCAWLFVTPWTVTQSCQAPQFMGFSRQEYWSGLPCPPPGDLPDSGIKLMTMWEFKSRGFRFGSSHYPTLSTFLTRCWWAEQAIYLFQRSFSIWKRRCAVNFGQGWLWNNEAS